MSPPDRQSTRTLIRETTLDAVERLSSVASLSTINLKRLADEAGVSTMVVYSHFGDRFGLEQALLHRSHESLITELRSVDDPSFGTLAVALRAWAMLYPARFAALFTSGTLDPELDGEIGTVVASVTELLTELCGTPTSDGSSPDTALLLAAVVGIVGFEASGRLRDVTDLRLRRLLGDRLPLD